MSKDDDEESSLCPGCGAWVTIDRSEYERPVSHAYCWPCSSGKLDDIFSAELPQSEQHLRPVVETGGWINASAALGCVKPELARAYAAELLRACEEAERMR